MGALFLWSLLLINPLSAATLYEANFSTNAGTVNLSSWTAHHSATAIDISTLPSNNNPYRTGVINTGGVTGNALGYLFAQNYSAAEASTPATNYFLATTAIVTPISLTGFSSLNASWFQDSTPINVPTRLTVQVNGVWYATVTQFTENNTLSTPDSYQQKSVNLLSSSWYKLNFTSGSVLSLDTAETFSSLSALGTNITGLGFYLDALPAAGGVAADYKTMRLDALLVTGVPEPGRATLILLSFALVFSHHRSRKNP